MPSPVILFSIPGLRAKDLEHMPALAGLCGGDQATLMPSFPCVTWPVQANMLTGKLPREHGIVANGFYWRDKREVEMWTAGNEAIAAPQIWDLLHEHDAELTSAAWFPMLSKRSGADYVCMPAPVHNPDGSESLWCYTKPTELYGELLEKHGHFPLKHFWGPLAAVASSAWIADSAALVAQRYKPRFFYIYLPHLDYAAQKTGPDSPAATKACEELDAVIGRLAGEFAAAYEGEKPLWLAASEYTIVPVDHVAFPNRVLREAGLLTVKAGEGGEVIDYEASDAWALADHQMSHVFVRQRDPAVVERVAELFRGTEGIAEVLAGEQRGRYNLDHERAGDVVLVSQSNSWQSYYYWLDDANAPKFAHTVDIHKKPGYDPVELHVNMETKSIPLDASLVKGSHGAPATTPAQQGVMLSSRAGHFGEGALRDVEVCPLVLREFGIED